MLSTGQSDARDPLLCWKVFPAPDNIFNECVDQLVLESKTVEYLQIELEDLHREHRLREAKQQYKEQQCIQESNQEQKCCDSEAMDDDMILQLFERDAGILQQSSNQLDPCITNNILGSEPQSCSLIPFDEFIVEESMMPIIPPSEPKITYIPQELPIPDIYSPPQLSHTRSPVQERTIQQSNSIVQQDSYQSQFCAKLEQARKLYEQNVRLFQLVRQGWQECQELYRNQLQFTQVLLQEEKQQQLFVQNEVGQKSKRRKLSQNNTT
eukprot:TRINITY_DN12175_c0_g1_i2.p1 TRINITY_DN12175_c0_g1~~TRINITY_DN12175_c0_g1_i2.p1  ORF type:complete len:267 (+),score=23.28 TRINITY_DN12175_c0_g1_i2:352-1152(+)